MGWGEECQHSIAKGGSVIKVIQKGWQKRGGQESGTSLTDSAACCIQSKLFLFLLIFSSPAERERASKTQREREGSGERELQRSLRRNTLSSP